MDASNVIRKVAEVIKARQRGVQIEDAVEEIFAPEELPPAGAPMVEQPSPAPAALAGGAPEEAPPSLQTLLSNLSISGRGNASARTTSRR
jgi:hypothetical protein